MTPPLFCLPLPIHPQASTFSVKNTFCPQPGNKNLKELSQGGRGESQNRHQGPVGHSHNQAAFLCPRAVSGQRSKDKLSLPLYSLMPPIFCPLHTLFRATLMARPPTLPWQAQVQEALACLLSRSFCGCLMSPLPDPQQCWTACWTTQDMPSLVGCRVSGLLALTVPEVPRPGAYTHISPGQWSLAQPRSTAGMPSGGAGRSSP